MNEENGIRPRRGSDPLVLLSKPIVDDQKANSMVRQLLIQDKIASAMGPRKLGNVLYGHPPSPIPQGYNYGTGTKNVLIMSVFCLESSPDISALL